MRGTPATFGAVLRRLRSAAALSQEALAERAGLSRSGISHLERGLHPAPHLETVRLLADALALGKEDRAALLAAARPALFPSQRSGRLGSPQTALPTPLTRLIGREAERTALSALMQQNHVRLLTITGPGGVGKTRLAIAVAKELADDYAAGAVFVDLSPLNDATLVIPAIAAAIGVPEGGGRPLQDKLSTALASEALLLLLDNGERLLAAAPDLVALLAGAPGLTILTTSREAWHVRGEHAFPLQTLPVPDAQLPPLVDLAQIPAVALFLERATASRPDFSLTAENAGAVAAICQRLDGLPLAIELAAARIAVLPAPALLERLEQRLQLLVGGPRDAPARLRTLRDAIAWSTEMLSDAEAQLFRRLAIFVGGFSLEAAEAIGELEGRQDGKKARRQERGERDWPTGRLAVLPSSSVLDLISSLVDKSLLQQVARHHSHPRFTMLETIREFAREELAVSSEAADIAELHATWYFQFAGEVRQRGGLSHRTGLETLEAEHPNLRAALTWLLECGETTTALHLAGELAEFWQRHGHIAEGIAWLERALAVDAGEPTAARANALVGLNMLLWDRNELTKAEQLLGEAVSIARAVGDAGALAYARLHQGYLAAFQGDFDLARVRGEEALTTSTAIPQSFSGHGVLWLLGFVALARGEDERATELHECLLASARAQGDEVSIADALFGLAVLAERRGELRSALAGYAEAATVCRGFDQKAVASYFLEAAAATAVVLGHVESAVRIFGAADALRSAVGAVGVLGAQIDSDRQMQALDAARASLPAERFVEAWSAGAALSFDEALAEVTALVRASTM